MTSIFTELFETIIVQHASTGDKVEAILDNQNITVVRTQDLAAVLWLAGLAGTYVLPADTTIATLLLDAYYRLDEGFNTGSKTAAEVVSEY